MQVLQVLPEEQVSTAAHAVPLVFVHGQLLRHTPPLHKPLAQSLLLSQAAPQPTGVLHTPLLQVLPPQQLASDEQPARQVVPEHTYGQQFTVAWGGQAELAPVQAEVLYNVEPLQDCTAQVAVV